MDYHPIIVMITGHAFVGARATAGGPIAFIETTMVGSSSAEKAISVAVGEVAQNFAKISSSEFVGLTTKPRSDMIDVRQHH